jgi:hypothetical protein
VDIALNDAFSSINFSSAVKGGKFPPDDLVVRVVGGGGVLEDFLIEVPLVPFPLCILQLSPKRNFAFMSLIKV